MDKKEIRKKKVLFVATVQSHIMNFHTPFLNYFYKLGYDVHVATSIDLKKYVYDMDNVYKYVKWKDISFSRSPFNKSNIKAYKDLKKIINENKYEIIHCHTPIAAFITRIIAMSEKLSNIVYTAHGFHFFYGASIKYWLLYYTAEYISSKYTKAIITMNEEDYYIAKRKFKSRKTNIYKVNGVGVDLNKYNINNIESLDIRSELGIKESDIVVVVVAELIKRKNHKQIIDAIERVRRKNNNVKLLLAGDGELDNYYEMIIKENKMQDYVVKLGFRNDIERIIYISDIVALTSHHEGLPKNIMEGMAMGKPILATDVRGNNDLVVNEINGYLVKYGDIEDTYDKLLRLVEDYDLRKKMGNKSLELIKNYSLDTVMRQMDKIYKDNFNV